VEVPPSGLAVPDDVIVQGLDDSAALVAGPGTQDGTVKLGVNAGLRDLAVRGPAANTSTTNDCVVATGAGTSLHRVHVSACATGVRILQNAALLVTEGGTKAAGDLTFATIFGESGASLRAVSVDFVGPAQGGAVDGFASGHFSLVRPSVSGAQRGIRAVGGTGTVTGAQVVEALEPVSVAQGAAVSFLGGTFSCSGEQSVGLSGGADSTLVVRGVSVSGCRSAGVSVAGAAMTITASTLTKCGGANSAAVAMSSGGSFVAHGLRIEEPGQIGIFALKDAGEMSLTGTVVEATTFRGVWVFGGKATLRTVQIAEPGEVGLAFGDPAQPIDVRDLDIVKHEPCPNQCALVFADRAALTADQLSFHTLIAGAGTPFSSVDGAPVCSKLLTDPAGGTYLRVNGNAVEACF
jgi:hypothetical protein